jgi:hypothetical protein
VSVTLEATVGTEFDQIPDFHESWTVVWKTCFVVNILLIMPQVFEDMPQLNFWLPTITNQIPDSLNISACYVIQFLKGCMKR